MIKRLVKLPVSFLLISLFALFASAQDLPQEKCVFANAPRLHGLSLGMSPAEVQSVFGTDPKIKVKTNGDRGFFQNYIGKQAPASLSGIRALYLRFLDGRLYQIEIFYEERADVPTLEAFAANLSAQMQLPADANWRFAKNKAVIDCGAFTLIADKPLNPRVELTDAAKLAEAEARRKKGK
jgi:hypothetical protein